MNLLINKKPNKLYFVISKKKVEKKDYFNKFSSEKNLKKDKSLKKSKSEKNLHKYKLIEKPEFSKQLKLKNFLRYLRKRYYLRKKRKKIYYLRKKLKKRLSSPQKKILKKRDGSGVLRIITNKRNIFCTLSDIEGNMRATKSSGLLKVKGRKRQALHIVRGTVQKIINQIFKYRLKRLILIHKGNAYAKKKKIVLKAFAKIKKIKFYKVRRPAPRSHNGCRPPKIRRK